MDWHKWLRVASVKAAQVTHVHAQAYYACASASGLITLLLAGMPETLPVARRQPIQWARTQPLACVQLLRPGSEMNRNSGGAVRLTARRVSPHGQFLMTGRGAPQ
jgi:hypothetical protein